MNRTQAPIVAETTDEHVVAAPPVQSKRKAKSKKAPTDRSFVAQEISVGSTGFKEIIA